MSKVFEKLKNLFALLPFGLRGADTEIMGAGGSTDGVGTEIQQQVSDERVAKHLLKGEVTKEVEELRYRTYKVERESDKYGYIGAGLAAKKESNVNKGVIKFSQENKLICEDILSELSRIDNYGVERYSVTIEYAFPVRIKLQEFLLSVDVLIKEGEQAITTLHFSDIMNPSMVRSKPFVNELEKLCQLFENNDTYGLSRNDYASSVTALHFVTFNATNDQPNLVSYSFLSPELIGVHHENGEYKIVYQWDSNNVIDLTEKFYNAELESKYKNKEKKNIKEELEIKDSDSDWWKEHYDKNITCSKCGKTINVFHNGFVIDQETKEPICLTCYKNSLLEITK